MGYVGFDQFCQFGINGAATIAFGNVVGGGIDPENHDLTQVDGIAGQADIVWGMLQPNATIETVYKGESLLTYCNRATFNGLPPRVYILGGAINVTNGAVSANGYVNRVSVSCGGVGEPVRVVYELALVAVSRTIVTAGQVAVAGVTAPYRWERGAVTIEGIALGCQSFETTLENNIRLESSLDAASSNLRQPEIAEPGNEVVTFRIGVKAPTGLNLGIDTPSLPYNASFLIGNGFTTRTIHNRGMYQRGEPIKFFSGGDTVIWDIEAESKHNSLRSAATAAWVVS